MELFEVVYGANLIETRAELFDGAVVITQPEAWDGVRVRMGAAQPAHVEMASDLTPDGLSRVLRNLPRGRVVGVGGGVAMDVAKWLHWKRGDPLVQIPGLPSVNACFTRMTAIRDRGIVRYEGDAVPEVVLVDFTLMRSAPRFMVRAGIGDVLSCHTARFDWELAVSNGSPPFWEDEAATASTRYVASLDEAAVEIREATDEGLRGLMELHREIGWRCHALGHARFEEGSEHFFAYCFEEVTGRNLLHGEIVSLGVLIMSAVQRNAPEVPLRIVRNAGTRHGLAELGLTWDEVEQTIRALPEFAAAGGYWDSMAQRMKVTPEMLTELRLLLTDGDSHGGSSGDIVNTIN